MSKWIALAAAVAGVGNTPVTEDDDICAKLDAFESAASQPNGAQPQSIEVFWGFDPDSIWSIACKRPDLPGPRQFCAWVPGNVSMEFVARFPERIWDCYRTGNNPFRDRKFRKRDVIFRTKLGGRLVMQTRAIPSPWVRLAVFPRGTKVSTASLPRPAPYKAGSGAE
jgi:hypothetical protein